jgi:hypothetical protein
LFEVVVAAAAGKDVDNLEPTERGVIEMMTRLVFEGVNRRGVPTPIGELSY